MSTTVAARETSHSALSSSSRSEPKACRMRIESAPSAVDEAAAAAAVAPPRRLSSASMLADCASIAACCAAERGKSAAHRVAVRLLVCAETETLGGGERAQRHGRLAGGGEREHELRETPRRMPTPWQSCRCGCRSCRRLETAHDVVWPLGGAQCEQASASPAPRYRRQCKGDESRLMR